LHAQLSALAAFVLAHLDLLGVDEDEAHLLGRGAHEQRGEDAVDATGLAGAGGAGDEHVWSGGQVEEHGPTGDVFADGDIERVSSRLRLCRGHDVAEADQLASVVGHLHPDGRTAAIA